MALCSLAQSPAPHSAPTSSSQVETRIRQLAERVEPSRLQATVRDLVAFGTRHVLSDQQDENRGTGAARRYLERQLREISAANDGRLKVDRSEVSVAARRLGLSELGLVNVVATLPGTTDPNRVYVVGGHYDSRNGDGSDGDADAPGANDDGSGTAVVVELCRVLASEQFPATIVFVCYDGEEQGLLGSSAHAAELDADEDLVVDGMITNDIVGNTMGMDGVRRSDYLRCFSYSQRGNDSVGRSMARAAARAARQVDSGVKVKLVFRGDRYGRGGDHRPFAQRGVPAIRFTEPREDFSRQHQNVTERDGRPYADLPEFMDFEYVAAVARINLALLVELASAPRVPNQGVRVQGARASYDTVLRWQPVDGVAGYEAVWRDTTSPDWEESLLLESDAIVARNGQLRYILKDVCVDDVVVGIRSVAVDGARSRVQAPPEPDALSNRPATRRRSR